MDQVDADHFDPNYHTLGSLVQGPNQLLVEYSLEVALNLFQCTGGSIYNLTEKTECRVLPKMTVDHFAARYGRTPV